MDEGLSERGLRLVLTITDLIERHEAGQISEVDLYDEIDLVLDLYFVDKEQKGGDEDALRGPTA